MANNAKLFLFTIISVILIYLDTLKTEIYSLYFHNMDEYFFHDSLLRILSGIKNLDPRIFFGTGFFNYGFLYFFSVFGVTSPFLIFEHSNFTIIIPRFFSSFFAIGSLNLIFKIIRLKNGGKVIFLLPLILLITSPAFWFNAIVFHPDWPYAFFILYSLYFLFKDENTLGRNYYLSIIAFSIAFSLKIQAIVYLPIIFLYIISLVKFSLKFKLKIFIYSLIIIFISRIVTNPYLLHPEGLAEFVQGFKADMLSNKTNHGGANVTFLEKIKMLHNWYFNIVLLLLSMIILLKQLYQYLFKKDYTLVNQLSITIFVNLAYLLFFINKAWQSYYLPCFTLIIVLLHFFILEKYPKRYIILFSVFICLNITFQFEFFYNSIYRLKFSPNKDLTYFKNSNLILKKYVKPDDNILVVGYGVVDFTELGLKYENIHYVFGKFETKHLLNYNTHYPGRNIIKNFVLVSKLGLNKVDLASQKLILSNYHKLGDSPHFILYSLNHFK